MKNSKKLERIENIVIGGVTGVIAAAALAAVCALFSGCTVNPDTGAAELFGCIEISDAALDVAEATANEAASSGGILGIVGVAAGTLFGIWRKRKEQTLKAAAVSVIGGVDEILAKAKAAEASGGKWTPTREELTALLKAAQEAAGTRSTVDELKAEARA